MYISNVLKEKRLEKGFTQKKLGELIGVTAVAISKWELGLSKPRPKFYKKLSNILGVNEKVLSGSEKLTKLEYIEVPYYKNLKVEDKGGSINHDVSERATEMIPAEALKNTHKSNVYCISASGNSMAPVFYDGAKLAIDSSKKIIKDGDLYLVSYGGSYGIKVLFKTLNGIRLCSYNTMFKDEEYTHDELVAFKVVGKIIWYSQILN
ncbi:XRE family transcriptional regulator [Vibrio harveyi]